MDFDILGALFVAATFGLFGAAMVWLGGKGQRGQIDFALGLHTRENTDPETWQRAHDVIGRGVVFSGFGFITVGILFVAAVNFLNLGENAIGILLLVLIALPTGWLMLTTIQGMQVLSKKPPAQ